MKKFFLFLFVSIIVANQFISPAIVWAVSIDESANEQVYEEEIQESNNNQEQNQYQQLEEPEVESGESSSQTSVENLEESSNEGDIERITEEPVQRNGNVTSIETSTISDWHKDEPILIAKINMELTTAFTGMSPGVGNAARVYGINNQFSGISVQAINAQGDDISGAIFVNTRSADYVDYQTRADSSIRNGWITLEIFGFVNAIDNVSNISEGYFDFGTLTAGIFILNTRGELVRREPDVTSGMRLMAKAGMLKINHVDDSGDLLADATQTIARPGDEYTTEALNLDGYIVKEIIGEPHGTYVPGNTDVTYIYTKSQLEAEIVPQTIDLGGRLTEEQLDQSVINVSFNGEPLSKDEYTVSLSEGPDTSIVGSVARASLEVAHKETGQSLSLEIPITINWGNAIRFNGFGNNSVGVFNWHPDIGVVTARRGTASASGNVHDTFSSIYYSFNLYGLGESNRSVIGNDTLTYSYDVRGTQTIASAVSEFGNGSGEINANIGDIIEVYHREPTRLRQYISPSTSDESVNSLNNRAYFELTATGYNLLTFDRVLPNSATIQLGMSKKELDENVWAYLDISATNNVSIVGFQEYPNTAAIGQAIGIIRVEERLSTGKFILRDYEVPFTIEYGQLEIANVTNGNFDFGEIEQSSRQQVMSAKGENAPTITINDYSNSTQWSMYVSASSFMNNEKQTLIGAEITLKNLSIKETVHTWLAVSSRNLVLSQTPQLVGAMSNPSGLYEGEHGATVIQVGEAINGSLTGVQLTIPANTPKDTGTYRSVVTWELVGDPTLGGEE